MVEDSQIEAKVSPFSVKKGEVKVFDGKDGYISMQQIVNRINLGHINELHFKILEIVNEFEFVTSRQLCQLLDSKNVEYGNQDKLNNKLDQMIKAKMLTRYFFSSIEEGKGVYRVYALEKMGKYLITSRGNECKWQPSDNTKPVGMIKKRLAGNQILIAYLRKVKAYEEYKAKPSLTAKTLGKTFKATGGSIKLTKNNRSIIFIFEVIRREDEWQKKLEDKMSFYKDFYENFTPGDSGYDIIPQLIIDCEDENHIVETFKIIIMKKIILENWRI